MTQRRLIVLAGIGLLVLSSFGRADELVLDLTTKLGIDKTVTAAKVLPVASQYSILREPMYGRFLDFMPDFPPREKYYLAIGSHASKRAQFPSFIVGIPWPSLKDYSQDKDLALVTSADGAKFQGAVLTEVTDKDGSKYPLWQCSKIAVKKYASKLQDKPHDGPVAKCQVQIDKLNLTFRAKKLGYANVVHIVPSQKFEMKVGDEFVAGVLSDFDKVVVSGSETGPVQIMVRAPSGKETTGELKTFNSGVFGFRDVTGCAVVMHVRSGAAQATKASFRITIENTKAGKRLPLELFAPVEKK